MGRSPLTIFFNLKKKEKKRRPWKEGLKRWGSLKNRQSSEQPVISYDDYRLSPRELLVCELEGIGACALLSYVYYRNLNAFLCLLPFGIAYPWYKKKELKRKRLEKLSSEFKEGITILASSLAAGYSVENAFSASLKELKVLYGENGLIVREFQYIVLQLRMNRPVEQLLSDFGRRSGLDDIDNFAEVFAAAKRSGGRMASIMAHTADPIRERMEVKEEIRTMTAARRFEQKIMNALPFCIVFYIDGASPGFFSQMYETAMGRILMSACLLVYVGAVVMAGRILEIEI